MRPILSLMGLICAGGIVAAGVADRTAAEKMLNGMPLSFERNAGQLAVRSAEWVGRANGYRVALDATGATVLPSAAARRDVVRMEFVNARRQAGGRPLEPLPGKANYLAGRDPARWIQNLQTYRRVEYDGVYEGVDVAWYGNQGQLEYDFLVRPGADTNRIRVRFEGTRKLALDENGDVRIETAAGAMKLRLPAVYQEAAGVRKRIEGRYRLRGANEIGFELAAYDKSKPLVIDPTLVYGTYFGAVNMRAIATDAQGNVYIGGYVDQSAAGGLPVVNAMQGSVLGSQNGFVVKFDPTGTVVLYSTYIGGSGSDTLLGIAVDASGEVIATGSTSSTDFPLVNPEQSQRDATHESAFAFKLNAAGSAFVYSTYIGASASNWGAVATDAAGLSYITGNAAASFTTTPGAAQTTFGGGASDAFAVKLGADGKLIYATLLGGSGDDDGMAIAADSQGNAYVAGATQSTSFPGNPPGAKAGSGGGTDTFVAKLTPDGSAVAWLALLGGSGDDSPAALVRDANSGTLYVAGSTTSADLPTTAGVVQPSSNGPKQGFVASLAADGMSFGFVTYLGGQKEDSIAGLALASSGQLALIGSTTSSGFPSVNAIQPTFGGNSVSLYKGANAGASWTPADTGLPGSVMALSVDPSNPGTILAAVGPTASFSFGVLRTTNGGASWTSAGARTPVASWSSNGIAQFLRSPANPAVVYLAYTDAAAHGPGAAWNWFVAFGSSDGGATWHALAQPQAPPSNYLGGLAGIAVSTTDANTLVEIDQNRNVYRSTDGGASFTLVSTFPETIQNGGAVAAGPNGTLLVGTSAFIRESPDFGTTWPTQLFLGANNFVTSPSNPSVIYMLGGASSLSIYGLFKSTDGGLTWGWSLRRRSPHRAP